MDTNKSVNVRMWVKDGDAQKMVVMTVQELIEAPWQIHSTDISIVLLNELRTERGLELMPDSDKYYKKLGEKNEPKES